MQDIYVVGDLTRLLLRYLDSENLSAPQLRRELAQIPSHSRITMQQWWRLLEQLQQEHAVPALGLRIGRLIRPEDSGILGYLIMYCDTLGEALHRFQRYQGLLHNLSRLSLTSQSDRLILSWDIDQGRSTQLSDEVFMAGLVNFIRQITDRPDLAPLALHFNHRVDFAADEYRELMACPVYFDAAQVSLELPRDALGLAVNTRNPHLLALLERQAEALLPTSCEDEFVHQLQQVLAGLISQGDATLANTAKQMLVSTRTLDRRLRDRDSSFGAQLRQTRQKLASLYLSDPSLSLQDVAFLLGYSEHSAFSRACRQWFGRSPRPLRAELQHQRRDARTAAPHSGAEIPRQ